MSTICLPRNRQDGFAKMAENATGFDKEREASLKSAHGNINHETEGWTVSGAALSVDGAGICGRRAAERGLAGRVPGIEFEPAAVDGGIARRHETDVCCRAGRENIDPAAGSAGQGNQN